MTINTHSATPSLYFGILVDMSRQSYIDIMMGSFGVCIYLHDGNTVHMRSFDFYHGLSRPTSKQHLIFRLMRSLRDILAQFKTADIRSAQVRVVYTGECTFVEPIHTEKKFSAPTLITDTIQQSIVQDIMMECSRKLIQITIKR